jgi:preprotein translocase subunit SecG
MLHTIMIVLYIVVSILLIVVILLQPGKGGGMGAVFGGAGSQTLFGGRGAVPFLSKMTAVLAVIFLLLSVGMTLTSVEKSVMSSGTVQQEQPQKPSESK